LQIGLTHGTDFAIWDFCGVPRYGSSPCTAGHKITSHPLDTKRCTRFGANARKIYSPFKKLKASPFLIGNWYRLNGTGGEGTGAHCTGNVPMVKGREYTFHIELAMQNASGAGWNATVVDEYTGEEHILGALFLENTPHADQWLWDAALLNGTATGPAEEQKRATRSTARGGIAGYGGLTVLESGATHHAANRTDPVTGKTINLGGLSFMEYPVRPT
jgi:hypothetical protein